MKEQNIKDVLGSRVQFHEELDRVKKEELVCKKFKLLDGKVIDDWDGEFGTSQFALMKVELEDGRQVTTLCGGKAVVRQISRLLKRNYLPGRIWCILNVMPGERGDYYLLDWLEEGVITEHPVANALTTMGPEEPKS